MVNKVNSDNPLIKKYKHKIIPYRTSLNDIIICLSKTLDIEEMSNSEFNKDIGENFLDRTKENVKNAVVSENIEKGSTFDFLFYKVLKTENNKKYVDFSKNIYTNINYAFIIMEKNTEYIYVSISKVYLQIRLLQGISQYDYDNNTNNLLDYLSVIEFLFNN